MAAGKVKPNFKTYIICSGLLYGEGERLLAPYFLQARLQDPETLTYYGNGKNRIPMIHVQDLITFIEKTIEKKPQNLPYIFAVDHNPKPTQKKIIEAISQGVGTGKTHSEQPT
jgi:nucleoside-diphosphate-sugar epimerase